MCRFVKKSAHYQLITDSRYPPESLRAGRKRKCSKVVVHIQCLLSLCFSTDTPLLVRSSSDSALGPQPTETEPSLSEGTTVMVRPAWDINTEIHTDIFCYINATRIFFLGTWFSVCWCLTFIQPRCCALISNFTPPKKGNKGSLVVI